MLVPPQPSNLFKPNSVAGCPIHRSPIAMSGYSQSQSARVAYSEIMNTISNGKMPFMNAIAEIDASTTIDKAGRIVVPKKLRDSLHLVAGTRITFRQEGTELVIAHESAASGLTFEDGIPVFRLGKPLPPDHVHWVENAREERADELFSR